MEKINFKNGQAPYINDTNLNKMQDKIENSFLYTLESTSTKDAFSANQGRVLNEKITILEESQLDVSGSVCDNVVVNKLQKQLNMCTFDFEGNFNYTANAYNDVGVIPSDFLPKNTNYASDVLMYFIVNVSGMVNLCQGRITSEGKVQLYTDGSNVSQGQQVRIHISWFTN